MRSEQSPARRTGGLAGDLVAFAPQTPQGQSPAVSATLLDAAREFTPRVEAVGGGTVLLDLRGLGRRWPGPHELAGALAAAGRARGLDLQVALAFSRTAALLLARGRAGLTVVPAGGEAEAVAPLPLTALDLPADRQDLFRRWGLRTLGDLAALPADGLAARLGTVGPRLIRLARGEDDVPLVATPVPEAFACTLDLEWPVDGLEPLAFLLARVLEPLCETLSSRCRRAASLTLDLRLVDGTHHRRTLRPAAPSAEARTWRTLLLLDLETSAPRDAIQAITVSAEPTLSRMVQFSLLDPAQPSPERLAETMARLHEWTADGRGGSPALLDTHRPGAFVMRTFAPGKYEPTVPTLGGLGGEGDEVAGKPPSAAGRALPGPHSTTPPAPRLGQRAFRPPLPARVTVDAGAPVAVSAPGVSGRVTDRAGPWRASGDWWDVAWSREEWDVAVEGRGLFRIYRDRLRESWFVDAEYD
jgi:protein ImuB